MREIEQATNPESLRILLGPGKGRRALRSAPLSIGESPYWWAAARILKTENKISEAVVLLQGPLGEPRRLGVIEAALLSGELSDADEVLDAVKDLVECEDDDEGSAAAKSFLAGWICADVVGRCLKNPGNG